MYIGHICIYTKYSGKSAEYNDDPDDANNDDDGGECRFFIRIQIDGEKVSASVGYQRPLLIEKWKQQRVDNSKVIKLLKAHDILSSLLKKQTLYGWWMD